VRFEETFPRFDFLDDPVFSVILLRFGCTSLRFGCTSLRFDFRESRLPTRFVVGVL
jgi:hypothetical protein